MHRYCGDHFTFEQLTEMPTILDCDHYLEEDGYLCKIKEDYGYLLMFSPEKRHVCLFHYDEITTEDDIWGFYDSRESYNV